MLNNADNMEKFIRTLASKSAQAVVQSRLGEKIQTESNPKGAGNDWFNIAVQDHPEIAAETKKALALGPEDSILQRLPLCIEISLKTVDEGDQMVLEVWSLDLQQQQPPPPLKDKDETSTNTATKGTAASDNSAAGEALKIYNRMGILLKSVVSLTRATPAYKLSRRQCADSYGIFYRIYVEQPPQVHTLGEGHKNVRIGQVFTSFGALVMSVAYRTKMTITPSSVGRDTAAQLNAAANGIMLKSDHFRRGDAATPKTNGAQSAAKMAGVAGATMGGVNGGSSRVIDIDKPMCLGAFTDIAKLRKLADREYVLPETPPFEWLLRCADGGSNGSIESLNRQSDSPVAALGIYNNSNNNHFNGINHNNNINTLGSSNNNNVTAFKSLEKVQQQQQQNSASPPSSHLKQSLLIPTAPSPPTTNSNNSLEDENLLKELSFPFGSRSSHVNDLAKFYRDCYHAPPLRGLDELQLSTEAEAVRLTEIGGCGAVAYASSDATSANSVDDLSRQLEEFETSLEDYDELVSQLGLTSTTMGTTSSSSGGGLQMSN